MSRTPKKKEEIPLDELTANEEEHAQGDEKGKSGWWLVIAGELKQAKSVTADFQWVLEKDIVWCKQPRSKCGPALPKAVSWLGISDLATCWSHPLCNHFSHLPFLFTPNLSMLWSPTFFLHPTHASGRCGVPVKIKL